MNIITFIIPFIILITIVVFIHEYGHYYFAKKYGVGVTDFSIGFGKELFGFNDKSGTRWKFCAIPLGGYVKFFGDRNVFSQEEQEDLLKEYNEEDQKKLFVVKPIYQRSLIVAAGPFANFLLAVQSGMGLAAIPDYMAHNVNNITKVLPEEAGKPTETHFVYPASLKNNARLMAFRNFIFSKVNEWKFWFFKKLWSL